MSRIDKKEKVKKEFGPGRFWRRFFIVVAAFGVILSFSYPWVLFAVVACIFGAIFIDKLIGNNGSATSTSTKSTFVGFGKKAAEENQRLADELSEAERKLDELGYSDYAKVQESIKAGNAEIAENNTTIARLQAQKSELSDDVSKKEKQLKTVTNKLARSRELYKSVDYAITNFFNSAPTFESCILPASSENELDELSPSVILKLHAMDMKDLRKAYKENDKRITSVLEQYSQRYTTKANKAIYQLMVVSLRAELQNVLYNLKYEKLDDAIAHIKRITAKYLAIAAEGNQSIAGTLTKFIGEIEYLFINAVKIEYNYYVKKEQARQEQAAIREQMRQEAAERKALEAEKAKIDAEETKYKNEIDKVRASLETAQGSEAETLSKRILELEGLLSDVIVKKEDIVKLQNGKAGSIYVISNVGSFGDDVFKVGMTRRLDPQDRVNELGDASVPFRFDVHSFIFSEDAASLETKLHNALDDKRVNKVNRRKEFFKVSIDELEQLVLEIDPTAEFNRVAAAVEYRQSESSDETYSTDYVYEDGEDDEGE